MSASGFVLSVQNLVPGRRGQRRRIAKFLQNNLNITASYSKSVLSVMCGKPFAYSLAQEIKLFPPKKETDWR